MRFTGHVIEISNRCLHISSSAAFVKWELTGRHGLFFSVFKWDLIHLGSKESYSRYGLCVPIDFYTIFEVYFLLFAFVLPSEREFKVSGLQSEEIQRLGRHFLKSHRNSSLKISPLSFKESIYE